MHRSIGSLEAGRRRLGYSETRSLLVFVLVHGLGELLLFVEWMLASEANSWDSPGIGLEVTQIADQQSSTVIH